MATQKSQATSKSAARKQASAAAARKQAPAAKKIAPAAKAEVKEVDGIREPRPGNGKCRAVWDACDGYFKQYHTAPTAQDMKAWSTESDANLNNTMIEFYRWRKFHKAEIEAAAKSATKH